MGHLECLLGVLLLVGVPPGAFLLPLTPELITRVPELGDDAAISAVQHSRPSHDAPLGFHRRNDLEQFAEGQKAGMGKEGQQMTDGQVMDSRPSHDAPSSFHRRNDLEQFDEGQKAGMKKEGQQMRDVQVMDLRPSHDAPLSFHGQNDLEQFAEGQKAGMRKEGQVMESLGTEDGKRRPKRGIFHGHGGGYGNIHGYTQVNPVYVHQLLKQYHRKKEDSQWRSSRSTLNSSSSRSSSRSRKRSRKRPRKRSRRSRTRSRSSAWSSESREDYLSEDSSDVDSSGSDRHRHQAFKKGVIQRKLRQSPHMKALSSGLIKLHESASTLFEHRPETKNLIKALQGVFNDQHAADNYRFSVHTNPSLLHGLLRPRRRHHDSSVSSMSSSSSSSISSISLTSDEESNESHNRKQVKRVSPNADIPVTIHRTISTQPNVAISTKRAIRLHGKKGVLTSHVRVTPANFIFIPLTASGYVTHCPFTHPKTTTHVTPPQPAIAQITQSPKTQVIQVITTTHVTPTTSTTTQTTQSPITQALGLTTHTTYCPLTHKPDMATQDVTSASAQITHAPNDITDTTTSEQDNYDFEPIVQRFEILVDPRLLENSVTSELSEKHPQAETTFQAFQLLKPWYHNFILSDTTPDNSHTERYITTFQPPLLERIITKPSAGQNKLSRKGYITSTPRSFVVTAQEHTNSRSFITTRSPSMPQKAERQKAAMPQPKTQPFIAHLLPLKAGLSEGRKGEIPKQKNTIPRLLPIDEEYLKSIPKLLPVNDAWTEPSSRLADGAERISTPHVDYTGLDRWINTIENNPVKKRDVVSLSPARMVPRVPKAGAALKDWVTGTLLGVLGMTDEGFPADMNDIEEIEIVTGSVNSKEGTPVRIVDGEDVIDHTKSTASSGDVHDLKSRQWPMEVISEMDGAPRAASVRRRVGSEHKQEKTDMKWDQHHQNSSGEEGNALLSNNHIMLSGSTQSASKGFANYNVGSSLKQQEDAGAMATGGSGNNEKNTDMMHDITDLVEINSQSLTGHQSEEEGTVGIDGQSDSVITPSAKPIAIQEVDSTVNKMSRLHEFQKANLLMGQQPAQIITDSMTSSSKIERMKVKEEKADFADPTRMATTNAGPFEDYIMARWIQQTTESLDDDADLVSATSIVQGPAVRWKNTNQKTHQTS